MPPLQTGFTSQLRETLSLSRCKLDEWVENEKATADATEEGYRQKLTQQQQAVDGAVTHLLALQLEGGLTVNDKDDDKDINKAHDKQSMLKERQAVQEEIEALQQELEERNARVKELQKERNLQKERALEASKTKANVEVSKRTTIDHLTRGIVNYKYLGLDFEKAEGEQLRFIFTEMDPNDPARRFSFVLHVESDEMDDQKEWYDVQDCDPPVDPDAQEQVLERINESQEKPTDEEMSDFIQGMRRAFLDSLN